MMKKYKEGDTIYLKGKVASVDTGFRAKAGRTYQVSFSSPKTSLTHSNEAWVDDNCVIEEPVANVKPELPKGVADELELAKQSHHNFIGYINVAIDNDYPETNAFVYFAEASSDERIRVLSDAWYNGYTVKPETKLYNLVLGKREDTPLQAAFVKINDWDDNTYLSLNAGSVPHDLTIPQYQFTQEEIDKYNENLWIKNLDLNNYKVEVKDDEEV